MLQLNEVVQETLSISNRTELHLHGSQQKTMTEQVLFYYPKCKELIQGWFVCFNLIIHVLELFFLFGLE